VRIFEGGRSEGFLLEALAGSRIVLQVSRQKF
jgi:hypothetical protein